MEHNKLLYLVYSGVANALLKIKGVKAKGVILFGGIPYICKAKGSSIFIGRKCRFMSISTGNNVGINHKCIIATHSKDAQIHIGDNCGFSGTAIWSFNSIQIGNNVKIGANVTIMDGDAHLDDPRSGTPRPIYIEDNVWVGANCIILKGVTIGKGSLIGAGSVVTKSIPSGVVAAGNPCRVIRELEENVLSKL